jgi:hypothetical protein
MVAVIVILIALVTLVQAAGDRLSKLFAEIEARIELRASLEPDLLAQARVGRVGCRAASCAALARIRRAYVDGAVAVVRPAAVADSTSFSRPVRTS